MSKNLFENPIFICGHRKSGTTLLLCLMDNHPELCVYPPDSAFFYGYYPKYDSDTYTNEEKIKRMIDCVLYQLEYELKELGKEKREKINFSIEKFNQDFIDIAKKTSLSPKNMLISLFKAYRMNWQGSKDAVRCVEKTTSTEIYATEIVKWFPNAKFIHVIRDPRDNWASLKSGWEKRYQNFNDDLKRLMQSMIDRGKLGLEFALRNQALLGNELYKVIKYEDLTNNPIMVMNEICDFIGIKYHPSLDNPTICGQLWKGNNFDGLKFEKPSNINVGKWRERISNEDAQLIEFYFGNLMKKFGYNIEFSDDEQMSMAILHYKWFNFAQLYSASDM